MVKNRIRAGEAFLAKYPDHPLIKLFEDPEYQAAIAAFHTTLKAHSEAAQADLDTKIESLAAETKTAYAKFCSGWEKK